MVAFPTWGVATEDSLVVPLVESLVLLQFKTVQAERE